MFSKKVSNELKRRMDAGEEHLRATYAIVEVFCTYLQSWLGERTDPAYKPLDAVADAAMVLAFVMQWRHHVVTTTGLTLEANFLTRETFLDIVTSCHGCIYRFPQFRDNYDGKFKPFGPRFTSAFSEYGFQYGRMAQTNSPVVSILGWFRHFKHYLYQQWLEADSELPVPASCRGIPHSIANRIIFPDVPNDYFSTDDELVAAIERGQQRAIALLATCGVDTQTAKLKGFFKRPCKHYPLKDTYISNAACTDAAATNKEDDPNGDDDAGDAQTVIDSEDAADAEAVMAQLMRTGCEDGDGNDQGAAAMGLLNRIMPLLSDFNQSIQEESKDRKYRFVVKKLMKAHQQHGESLDQELDFYRDDDDVAVLFMMEDGSRVWCLGNIEEVAVAKVTVDERRALAGNSANYLLGIDKVYKPNGVFIDDPKGLFILRWYREADKAGKVLKGYQNKTCAAYKLPLDNDKLPFHWTGTVQIISKVYLKKHSEQSRTYVLNKKDAKMVKDAMAKKLRA